MGGYRIAVLVGSLRRESLNQRLATAMERVGPPDFSFHRVAIGDLPLYNQDDDERQAAPVKRLKAEILAADGVLFVTPEYNRSIPGVLKNAIDHASRPYGRSAWTGKPAGLLGVSVSVIGTAMAQQHLRSILVSLDMPALAQPEAFIHATGGTFEGADAAGDDGQALLADWMDRYAAWVRTHRRPDAGHG